MSDINETKQVAQLFKEINKSLIEQNKLLDDNIQKIKQENDLEQEKLKLEEQIALGIKKQNDNYDKNKEKLQGQIKLNKQKLDSLMREKKHAKELLVQLEKMSDLSEEEQEQQKEKNKLLEESLKKLEKIFEQTKKLYLQDLKRNKIQEDAREGVKSIGKFLGLADDIQQTWLGKTEKTFKAFFSIDNAFPGIIKGLKETFSGAKIFEATTTKVLEATVAVGYQLDNTLTSFNKVTGAGGKFNDVINDMRFGSLASGVGLTESAEAMEALYLNFNDFSRLNKTSQLEIGKTTALMSKLGISAETIAHTMDISTKSLGMNIDESIHAQKEIINEALKLGLSPQKLASDFASALPKLAQYGKQSVQIFKELATQSKATGVSVGDLIGITQQFDTFEGAATAAGRLNAILGGNLVNSIDLLNASESERIDILKNVIPLSGKSWQELDKFGKMAVASAAGIQDLDKASRIFGTSAEAFEEARKAQEAEAISTQNLTKYAQQATSAQEKFGLAVQALSGAALPLLNYLNKGLEIFLKLDDELGGKLGPTLVLITGLFYGASKIIGVLSFATKALVAVEVIWNIVKKTGIGLSALSRVVHLAGSGALLSYSAATAVATEAQIGLNVAMTTNPIGLIVVAIGAAIASIALLIVYYKDIDGWVRKTTVGFAGFWEALFILGGPIGQMISFGKMMYDTWKDAIVEIKALFIDLGGTIQDVWNKAKQPLNFVIKGANAISPIEIPSFASGVNDFGGGVALVGENGPELVALPPSSNVLTNENSKSLGEAGRDLTTAKTSYSSNNSSSVRNQSSVTNNNNTTQTSDNGKREIVLMLDNRELGRAIVNIFEDKMKLNVVGI